MQGIDIRAMTIADYPAMISFWQDMPGVGLSSADEVGPIAAFLARNPGLSFCAWEGDRLAGTVLAGHDGRRGYLYHLAVHPHFRRQGLGRLLVERCLSALQAEGMRKCHIMVYGENTSGLAFWHSVNWHERPEIVIMSRNL